MTLLDTSVWIEYFKRNSDYKSIIDTLLRERKIIALDFIFGELLQGAKEQEKDRIIAIWEILPKVNISGIGFHAGMYSMENKLWDKGIGIIDAAIMYATINSNAKLWTLDKKIMNQIDKLYLYD